MQIAPDQLEFTKLARHNFVDDRTSASWADYSEEDLSKDAQDREDIERIPTVADVLEWLQHRGGRTLLVEYASCLDPLGGFKVEGKEDTDESDEKTFRAYLKNTYKLPID